MARIIFELVGVFLLPFIAYAGFLIWQEKHPRAAKAIFRNRALVIQSFIGLMIVATLIITLGLLEERNRGGYQPAIFKDGQLQPGRIN